jgi:hypothetical protein
LIEQAKSLLERALAPELWSNWLLVLAGIGGIIVAIVTLKKIERQTKAAKDAADAALLNAKAFINSERPWLVVDIEEGEMGQDIVRAINKGNTPAEMHEGHCECKLQRVGDFVPGDNFVAPFIAPIQALTVKEDSFEICRINPQSMIQAMQSSSWPHAPHVYGRILYWDTFTDRNRPDVKPHETWWCFTYLASAQRWYRTPNGYSKHT